MIDINMDEKVTVINLAPWNVGFPNLVGRGETCFAPSAKVRVKRDEISDQVSSGNKLFGLDEIGSHARKYLDFDSEDGKRTQKVISKDKIRKWFELKTQSSFEKNIKENVVTRAEKQFLLKSIKDLKLDSYEKIAFCQEYCKFSLRGI